MRFTKMQGAGNDYVYVDCFRNPLPPDPAGLSRAISDRHFGVGSDGLILICPSEKADARMRMFNADGSEAEMCGNGIRCVAKFLHDHGLVRKPVLTIETGRGILTLELEIEELAASTPGRNSSFCCASLAITLPMPQPGAVSVIFTDTF